MMLVHPALFQFSVLSEVSSFEFDMGSHAAQEKLHQGLLISWPVREFMDELSFVDTLRQRWDAMELGVRPAGLAHGGLSEETLISGTLDIWTGEAGRRVVQKYSQLLLSGPNTPAWKPWEAARSQANFSTTAELLMISMADAWRRLVFARDRHPYKVGTSKSCFPG